MKVKALFFLCILGVSTSNAENIKIKCELIRSSYVKITSEDVLPEINGLLKEDLVHMSMKYKCKIRTK